MSSYLTSLGRNFMLSLGGEGLQSLVHFVLNLLLIRALSVYDYGLFAIVFILGGIALTYGNALVSIPASVSIPRLTSPAAVNFHDVAFGSIAVATAACMALLVVIGLWLTIGSVSEAFAGGTFVGLWTVRNHVRATLFARRAMLNVTISDFTYSLSGFAFIALLLWGHPGPPPVTAVLWLMAAANAIAIVVALAGARRRVRISLRRGIRDYYRSIWPDIVWSVIGVTTWNIQGQALTFLVAAIVGPAAYAPIAAGLVLFRPLLTSLNALTNVIRPEFAAGLAQGRSDRVKLIIYCFLVGVVIFCLVYDSLLWFTWPLIDAHIYGEKLANASMPLIVVLAGIAAMFSGSYHVALSLVQAAFGFRTVAIATTLGGIVGLAAVLILLNVSTVAWSLAGVVAGEAVCWAALWIAALRVLGRASDAGVPVPGDAVPATRPAAPPTGLPL